MLPPSSWFCHRILTLLCASVSAFLSTLRAYTSPVAFSFTNCTSPKCPRPMICFTEKSEMLILRDLYSSMVDLSETDDVYLSEFLYQRCKLCSPLNLHVQEIESYKIYQCTITQVSGVNFLAFIYKTVS